MDNYIKIAANEGNINAQQNIVNFNIPSGGVYNLRDSYIELMCHAESVSANTLAGGIFSVGLRWQNPPVSDANTQTHFINGALVKNCMMECEMKGMVESIRRVDILRQNLATLTKSQTQIYSEDYLSANSLTNPKQLAHWGIFSDLNKEGLVKSQYRAEVPIQIRLGDLMDVCNAVEYDTSLAGATHIQVELNLDKVKAYQTLTNANNILPNPDNYTSTADGSTLVQLEFGTGPNADAVRRCVPGLANSPYYVGQIIKVNGTGTGGGQTITDEYREITDIQYDGTTLSIFVNASLGTYDNGQGVEDMEIEIVDADSVSVEFDSANIVLRQVANPQGMRQIAFTTYELEEDNGNDLTSFRKQYQLPGEATNVVVMFPSENDDLNSVNTNLTSFRLSLNNEFLTDRDVVVDTPLYYNQLASTIQNMGYSLRNLQQRPGNSLSQNTNNVWDNSPVCVFVANYLQPQQSEKMLNLNLNAINTGIKKVAIYKQLPRLLSL